MSRRRKKSDRWQSFATSDYFYRMWLDFKNTKFGISEETARELLKQMERAKRLREAEKERGELGIIPDDGLNEEENERRGV